MATTPPTTGALSVRPLAPEAWDAFVDLVERHRGVWGGCWCTWFPTFQAEKTHTVGGNRTLQHERVDEGRAHAALVFDGAVAVGWVEHGPPDELPTSSTARSTSRDSPGCRTTG